MFDSSLQTFFDSVKLSIVFLNFTTVSFLFGVLQFHPCDFFWERGLDRDHPGSDFLGNEGLGPLLPLFYKAVPFPFRLGSVSRPAGFGTP